MLENNEYREFRDNFYMRRKNIAYTRVLLFVSESTVFFVVVHGKIYGRNYQLISYHAYHPINNSGYIIK